MTIYPRPTLALVCPVCEIAGLLHSPELGAVYEHPLTGCKMDGTRYRITADYRNIKIELLEIPARAAAA